MSSVWDQYVPEEKLRPQQVSALDRVWGAYEEGADVVLLQAPTGVGKSLIQVALARRFTDEHANELGQIPQSYLVTPQRSLQDQLAVYGDTFAMKGRGAYRCNVIDTTAATAPCTESPGFRDTHQSSCARDACPFFSALFDAQNARITVHNYASILGQSTSGYFSKRKFMSLDEGHTAAEWVRNYYSFDFTDDQVMELTTEPQPADDEFAQWLISRIMDVESMVGLSDKLKLNIIRMKAVASSMQATPLVVHRPRDEVRSIVPLKVGPIAWTLTQLGEKVMFSTATVLHKALFVAEMGLGKKNVHMIDVESPFPACNRPVVKSYVGSMSFKHKKRTLPLMVERAVEIASRHHNEQGIVHTVSRALAEDMWIGMTEAMPGRVIELLPTGSDREEKIRHFLNGALGPSAILIGASMAEGLDGKYDACRWQIVCKVPFPSFTSPVVAHLMGTKDPDGAKWAQAWYSWKTAQTMMQTFGRCVRAVDDFGVTYVLDSSFQRVLASGFFPGYITEAIK